MKKLKLFDPIGLGDVLESYYVVEDSNGAMSVSAFNERNAAAPLPSGSKIWLMLKILYGHFNGPKMYHWVMTDGDDTFLVGPIDTASDRFVLKVSDLIMINVVDRAMKEFIRKSIIDRFFE